MDFYTLPTERHRNMDCFSYCFVAYFKEERRDVLWHALMPLTIIYCSTYGKATGSRYDSHKKSELRSLYNNIIKLNKESPLYKITQTGDVKEFAIDIKANAHPAAKRHFCAQ